MLKLITLYFTFFGCFSAFALENTPNTPFDIIHAVNIHDYDFEDLRIIYNEKTFRFELRATITFANSCTMENTKIGTQIVQESPLDFGSMVYKVYLVDLTEGKCDQGLKEVKSHVILLSDIVRFNAKKLKPDHFEVNWDESNLN